MKTIVLNSENIYSYSTKQEGSGRQGLYLSLYNLDGAPDQTIYWGSTFPNPKEQWNLHTWDNVFNKQRIVAFDEDGEPVEFEDIEGEYSDFHGEDVDAEHIFDSIFDGIVAMVTGDEVEVKEECDE